MLTFNEDNIKSYNENSNKGYILEVDVEYPKNLQRSHTNFLFLPKWIKIKKCEKFIWNLHDQEKYIMHIRALKLTLNNESILK